VLQILAELTPIEEMRDRQNGWRMIYFHHRDTEHTEVSQRILNEVFRIRLYEAKALKARLISAMGVSPWSRKSNTFLGFGRIGVNRENKV
jgi:hypothetical protein